MRSLQKQARAAAVFGLQTRRAALIALLSRAEAELHFAWDVDVPPAAFDSLGSMARVIAAAT